MISYTVEVYEKGKLIIVEDFNDKKDALHYFTKKLHKHVTETVGSGNKKEYEMNLIREYQSNRLSIHIEDPNGLWHVCIYDIEK